MIESLLLIFGITSSSTYYVPAMIFSGCIVIFVCMELLFLISHIFLKMGGYK